MRIELDDGQGADAVAFDGTVFRFVGPRAFAPGAPVHLSTELDGTSVMLEGRCIGSRRTDSGAFDVRMRFVNLRRAQRESLLAALV